LRSGFTHGLNGPTLVAFRPQSRVRRYSQIVPRIFLSGELQRIDDVRPYGSVTPTRRVRIAFEVDANDVVDIHSLHQFLVELQSFFLLFGGEVVPSNSASTVMRILH
jgi:hypothetical protein